MLAQMQVAQATIHEHDKDGDGKLSFQEFKSLLSQSDINAMMLP
jgi:Ca2+-binding EF-hand superfamily protein